MIHKRRPPSLLLPHPAQRQGPAITPSLDLGASPSTSGISDSCSTHNTCDSSRTQTPAAPKTPATLATPVIPETPAAPEALAAKPQKETTDP